MKNLKYVAFLGLALTILPSFLFLAGMIDKFGTVNTLMAVGMVIWYLAATPWLGGKKEELDDSTQDQI